jgi:hypothetical protein
MTQEQIDAQAARGVPRGYATFTLMDNTLSEVSGVFDGAVPGAGFRKAMSAARHRQLSREEIAQVRSSYGALLNKGEFGMDPETVIDQASDNIVKKVLNGLLGTRPAQSQVPIPVHELIGTGDQPAAPAPASAPDPQVIALQQQLAERDAKLAQVNADERTAKATSFADTLVTASKLLPAARENAMALMQRMLLDDEANPAEAGTLSRAELLESFCAELPAHRLTQELALSGLPAGAALLDPDKGRGTDLAEEGRKQGSAFVDETFPEKK